MEVLSVIQEHVKVPELTVEERDRGRCVVLLGIGFEEGLCAEMAGKIQILNRKRLGQHPICFVDYVDICAGRTLQG